jgi:hypothetical protein
MPQSPTISWELPLESANVVLAILGKQPFEQVADLIMELRNQAGRQLQALQQQPGMKLNGEDHAAPC